MVIIGYADDGPVWKPVYIDTYEKAKSIFGTGDLSRAFMTAYLAGGMDIYLMRINGSYPKGNVMVIIDNKVTAGLAIQSKSAGAKYNNNISLEVITSDGVPTQVIITNFDGSTVTYNLENYPTLSQLSEAINFDAEVGLVDLTTNPTSLIPYSTNVLSPGKCYVTGGTDDSVFDNIETLLIESLGGYNIGVLTTSGIYYGDDTNYIENIAKYCYEMNKLGSPTLAVISIPPKDGNEVVENYLTDLIDNLPAYIFEINGEDAGAYIIVTAGEVELNDGSDSYVTPVGVAMGALLTRLQWKFSTTNKRLFDYGNVVYSFTNEQLKSLKGMNINPIRPSIRNNIVFDSALTKADSELLKSITNIRIGQRVIKDLTSKLDNFIGGIDTGYNSLMVEQCVLNTLSDLVYSNYIRDFTYRITDHMEERVIEIEIVPINEIMKLSLSITL